MVEFNPEWKVTINSPNYERVTSQEVSIVILVINILSMASCIFIMVIFKREKSLRTIPNFFVFNATIADFMTSLTHGVIHLILLITGKWQHWLCQYSGWTATVFGGSSLSALALIALERYFSTVRESPLSKRSASLLVISGWVFSTFLSAFPIMLGQEYLPEPSNVYCIAVWTAEVPAWIIFAFFVFAHITLSISVIGGSYYQIYRKVMSVKSQLHGVNSDNKKTKNKVLDTASKDSSGNASAAATPNSATLASSFNRLLSGSMKSNALSISVSRPSWWVSVFGGQEVVGNTSVPVLNTNDSNGTPSSSITRPRSISSTNAPKSPLRGARPVSMINSLTAGGTGGGVNECTTSQPESGQSLRRKTSLSTGLMQSFKSMRSRANSNGRKLEKTLFRKSVIITAVFSINWSPYLLLVAWQFITGYRLPEWYHIIAALGVYLNCVTNPILCLFLDTRWIKASKNLLGLRTASSSLESSSVNGKAASIHSRSSSMAASVKNFKPQTVSKGRNLDQV